MWIVRSKGVCWFLMVIGAWAGAVPACAQSTNPNRSTLATMPFTATSEMLGLRNSKATLKSWENLTQDLTHLPQRNPQRNITAPLPQNSARTPYSCTAKSMVCYDERRGQTVVPLTRSLMPDIPGLTKVGLTIKRSGINVRYSF